MKLLRFLKKIIRKVFKTRGGNTPDLERELRRPYKPAGQKPNIALIVGHNKKAKGAKAFNGVYEYEYNSDVAEKVKALCQDHCVEVFYKDGLSNKQFAKKVSKFNPRVAIELHFNASGIPKASGCEALVIEGDHVSAFYARGFCKILSEAFKIRRRGEDGIKWVDLGDRGFKNLERLKHEAVFVSFLIEPEFFDFKTAASQEFISNKEKYANVFFEFLETHF